MAKIQHPSGRITRANVSHLRVFKGKIVGTIRVKSSLVLVQYNQSKAAWDVIKFIRKITVR